jgi:hypothetical protein
VKREPKAPKWNKFDRWVILSALVGLGVAVFVFLTVMRVLFGDWHAIANIRTADDPSKILTMTATVLGGITIGGAAVMQYRKHKWAEYQAHLEEDSKTGDRLRSAIDHLGNDANEHIRIGAIYELERLAEDSQRDRERIAKILTRYIREKMPASKEDYAQDTETAADVLQALVRVEIERTSGGERPLQFVFDATEQLSVLAVATETCTMAWQSIAAKKGLDLHDIHLEQADLSYTRLEGVLLWKAHFAGVDLRYAHLEGADLR